MHLAMRLHLAAAKRKKESGASEAIVLPALAPERAKPTTGPLPPKKEEPEEAPDYEELEDGSFECLHCGKVYRPSSRAESFVKAHVTKEHR